MIFVKNANRKTNILCRLYEIKRSLPKNLKLQNVAKHYPQTFSANANEITCKVCHITGNWQKKGHLDLI